MEVGQKVYLKPINNALRYGSEIRECVITKVGRKYFYACKSGEREDFATKFSLKTMFNVTTYSPDWEVYLSIQDILDERESEELNSVIRKHFDHYGKPKLTLDQLRQIKRIIDGGEGVECHS